MSGCCAGPLIRVCLVVVWMGLLVMGLLELRVLSRMLRCSGMRLLVLTAVSGALDGPTHSMLLSPIEVPLLLVWMHLGLDLKVRSNLMSRVASGRASVAATVRSSSG